MFDTPDQLYRRIAAAITYDSSEFSLKPCAEDAQPLRIPGRQDEAKFISQLTRYIYANYYAFEPRLFDTPDPLVAMGQRLSDPEFWGHLRAANPGNGYFDPGWHITSLLPQERAYVQKQGLSLVISTQRHLSPLDTPSSGVVSVRFPKDAALAAPGFYVAYSNSGPERGSQQSRIYLNLKLDSVVSIVEELLKELNSLFLPFTLKIICDRTRFARRDNTVLYIDRSEFSSVSHCLVRFHAKFAAGFQCHVPSFVKPLLSGIGVADNPAPTETGVERSFGQHRSKLLAEAIGKLVETSEAKSDPEGNMFYRAMVERLKDEGIDPTRPYLNYCDGEDYNIALDRHANAYFH